MSSPILQVCCLLPQPQTQAFTSLINQFLLPDRYSISIVLSIDTLLKVVKNQNPTQDCLVIWGESEIISQKLEKTRIFLPMVAITSAISLSLNAVNARTKAIVRLLPEHIADLPSAIDRAIAAFIRLPLWLPDKLNLNGTEYDYSIDIAAQQQYLSKKLKERLGYLGVYYKRDSRQFLRHLSVEDKQAALDYLSQVYRDLTLEYFKDKPDNLNQKIDEFVNLAFFGDVSVSQVLEIHMNLMDEFSKQLKLEGRSADILLDYRITLIDIIAHLCEMYRRSIPKEASS